MSYQTDDKIGRTQREVEEVQGQVSVAIQKTIDRGERLENLEDKAQNLENQANRFNKQATQLKWKMCCQSWVHTAVLITIALIILILIIWAAGGFKKN